MPLVTIIDDHRLFVAVTRIERPLTDPFARLDLKWYATRLLLLLKSEILLVTRIGRPLTDPFARLDLKLYAKRLLLVQSETRLVTRFVDDA